MGLALYYALRDFFLCVSLHSYNLQLLKQYTATHLINVNLCETLEHCL